MGVNNENIEKTSPKMSAINNATEILRFLRFLPIPILDDFSGSLHKLVLHFLGANNVVGSYACLTGVYKLPPEDPLRCHQNINSVVDVYWAVIVLINLLWWVLKYFFFLYLGHFFQK